MKKFLKIIYFLEINSMFIFIQPLGYATNFSLKLLMRNMIYHLVKFNTLHLIKDVILFLYNIILSLIKILYLPIVLIFFFSNYRFCQLNFSQIGIINYHLLYMVKQNLINGKKTIIFIPKGTKFSFLKKVFKNLIIIDSQLMYVLALPLRSFGFISILSNRIDPLLNDKFEYSYSNKLHIINRNFKKLKQNQVFNLNKNYLLEMQKLLEKMKLDLNYSKTIIFHVREKNPKLSNKRSSDLNNYLKTIKYLIDRNYFVIRLTDNFSKKLNIKKNYLELNIDIEANRKLQYFLIYKTLGFIGGQSGPSSIPLILSKPILETNMNNAYPHSPNKKSLFLLKKVKIGESFKSLNYLIKLKYYNGLCIAQSQLNKKKIKVIENTEQEIFQATKEFIKTINSKKQKMTINQKKFKMDLPLDLEMKYFDSNLSNAYIKMNKNLF